MSFISENANIIVIVSLAVYAMYEQKNVSYQLKAIWRKNATNVK